ncbi:MOSC domain-containing protein [Paenibacillus lignilyticus]|uniref:MOSC domain-containing protein n=1 Tax=Paenibacillus lignilyticus TaxID=1172615 RepID=A0ABS5CBI4_9BACL|nr:MOSC domain-containing protein [Paenibacillus lignilyticus]MBP3963354.1 MOSC domain-containing protein [Paenibacillus lignilyticus]
MELGTVISINTGLPETVKFGKKDISTGINKSPIGTQPVYLSRTGLNGDGQGDLVFHGGADKAVCVYSAEHFPYWEGRWQREVLPGAFGENFTVSALTEHEVCIGDIWSVGETVVQVSQPRQPCYKLGMKHQLPELAHEVQLNGFTGFYLRVLAEGHVRQGEKLLLTESHPAAITIAEANRVMHIDKQDKAGIRSLLAIAELSESWQHTLAGRLEKLEAE